MKLLVLQRLPPLLDLVICHPDMLHQETVDHFFSPVSFYTSPALPPHVARDRKRHTGKELLSWARVKEAVANVKSISRMASLSSDINL